MFGRRKRQPDARPNTAATSHPAPSATGRGRLEESPPLPIDGLGEDLVLAAEPRRLYDYRGPIHGIVRRASRQFAPAALGVLHHLPRDAVFVASEEKMRIVRLADSGRDSTRARGDVPGGPRAA